MDREKSKGYIMLVRTGILQIEKYTTEKIYIVYSRYKVMYMYQENYTVEIN